MSLIDLTPEEQAVLVPLQALLDGLRQRDQAAMLAQVMAEGGATIIREGRVLHYSLRTLLERPLPPGVIDEQIYDPYVRIDHDIAMIWAPYKVFLDGKLHHWGTNDDSTRGVEACAIRPKSRRTTANTSGCSALI